MFSVVTGYVQVHTLKFRIISPTCAVQLYRTWIGKNVYTHDNSDLDFNRLNAELNPICRLLALLGGATIVVVSRLRVNYSPYYHIYD